MKREQRQRDTTIYRGAALVLTKALLKHKIDCNRTRTQQLQYITLLASFWSKDGAQSFLHPTFCFGLSRLQCHAVFHQTVRCCSRLRPPKRFCVFLDALTRSDVQPFTRSCITRLMWDMFPKKSQAGIPSRAIRVKCFVSRSEEFHQAGSKFQLSLFSKTVWWRPFSSRLRYSVGGIVGRVRQLVHDSCSVHL